MSRSWQLLPMCVALGACQPDDGDFLALEPLMPPTTASIGVPVRVTAVGGHVVQLELTQGSFDEKQEDPDATMRTRCLTLGEPPADGVIAGGTDLVIVVPTDVEALLVGRLYATDCSQLSGKPPLASVECKVRVQEANEMQAVQPAQGGGS